jgi:hypothetical protein
MRFFRFLYFLFFVYWFLLFLRFVSLLFHNYSIPLYISFYNFYLKCAMHSDCTNFNNRNVRVKYFSIVLQVKHIESIITVLSVEINWTMYEC